MERNMQKTLKLLLFAILVLGLQNSNAEVPKSGAECLNDICIGEVVYPIWSREDIIDIATVVGIHEDKYVVRIESEKEYKGKLFSDIERRYLAKRVGCLEYKEDKSYNI